MGGAQVTNTQVKAFWEQRPVAAAAIGPPPGSKEFFEAFDRMREAPDCEPYQFSNKIHGYEDSSGLRVLDVGCGNGYVLSRYARHGAEVCGIDLTETAIELSRRRFELEGLPGDFRLTDGDGIPYPEAHFDIACSMGVLHHIEDPRPMIAEMHRVLRPGARLILMLYYRYSWKHLVIHPLKRAFDPRYRGKTLAEVLNMNDGDNCPLAKVYRKSEVRNLLTRFERIELRQNLLSWKQLFLIPRLGDAMAKVLPACSESGLARVLGWNLYVSADKDGRR